MKCPVCSIELVISERQGVEIDYCPKCRGVWLDRGELDKIIERTYEAQSPSGARDFPQTYPGEYHEGYKKKYKRRGFLDDIFDF